MRATLDMSESRWLFKSSWTVSCKIEFTEIELAAIRYGKAGGAEIYSTTLGGKRLRQITLSDVVREGGMYETWPDKIAAERCYTSFEEDVRRIKSLIDRAERNHGGPKVIEL